MAWNRETENKAIHHEKGPRWMRGIFASLLVVAFSTAALWLFWQDNSLSATEKKTIKPISRINQAKRVFSTNGVAKVDRQLPPEKKVVGGTKAADGSTWESYNLPWLKGGKLDRIFTNGIGQVVEVIKTPDGKKHELIRPPMEDVFDNVADQMLAMSLDAGPGGMVPMPISGNLDSEFKDALSRPIEIKDTDSDEVKRIKEGVIALREQMQEAMKSGRSFNEVLSEHQNLANENAEIRLNAQQELNEIAARGDKEDAEVYLQAVNQTLAQMGAAPITMPLTEEEKAVKREEKLRRRDERRKEKEMTK